VSQVLSAPGVSVVSVTVSYGPTVPSCTTVTSLLGPNESPAASRLATFPQPPLRTPGGGAQSSGGLTTFTEVVASSVSNHASVETSTRAPGLIGKTQAKSVGLPWYSIWSHRTVWTGETESTMRCPVTTVVSVSEAR
jgi:hypothetical protein